MKRRILWGLVALNLLLGGLLVARLSENPAEAQRQLRRPGDYLIVPGRIPPRELSVLYILDTHNRTLGAMALDQRAEDLEIMPPIDLDRLFEEALFDLE